MVNSLFSEASPPASASLDPPLQQGFGGAFPLKSPSSNLPALLPIQPRAMNLGALQFVVSWAESSPSHDSFHLFHLSRLSSLQALSPNLPEPPSPNTVPFGQSKSGWGDSAPECAHFLARACAPACTAGTVWPSSGGCFPCPCIGGLCQPSP